MDFKLPFLVKAGSSYYIKKLYEINKIIICNIKEHSLNDGTEFPQCFMILLENALANLWNVSH